MCVIFFALDSHPKYQLVVAANRDEYYNRPDLAAAYWPEYPYVLAGKDLKQGGTWMGITTQGRLAALTNYRDPASFNPQAPSRGALVQSYLTGSLEPEAYISCLKDGGAAYNGFNLLMGSPKAIYYYSNREKLLQKIEKGIHGLSNSLLDTPWPKVSRGKKALADCLQAADVQVESLFAMMANQEQPDDQELPQTGVSLEMERMLAPTFVASPTYGTKITTLITVDRDEQVRFWERRFMNGQINHWDERSYSFEIKSP